jgi:hypothetical protein
MNTEYSLEKQSKKIHLLETMYSIHSLNYKKHWKKQSTKHILSKTIKVQVQNTLFLTIIRNTFSRTKCKEPYLETMYKIHSLPLEEERRRLELSYPPTEQSTKSPYTILSIKSS